MSAFDSMRRPASPDGSGQYSGLLSGSGLVAMVLGAIGGLIVGLLIGWVVWPVEWTNAWPTDLSPEAKAHYLAAVAESYAYYGDEAAAVAAQARLNSFGENLAAGVADAQEFFRENPSPNSRVYISYLGQMAAQLGLESADIVTSPDQESPAGPDAAPAAGESPTDGDGSRSWLTWLISVIAALLLIGGGLYIITRLARMRQNVVPTHDSYADEVDEFDDEFDDEPFFDDEVPPFEQTETRPTSDNYARSGVDSASSGARATTEDYQFDEESDDNLVYSPATSIDRVSGLQEEQDLNEFETDGPEWDQPAAHAPEPGFAARKDANTDQFEAMSGPRVDQQLDSANEENGFGMDSGTGSDNAQLPPPVATETTATAVRRTRQANQVDELSGRSLASDVAEPAVTKQAVGKLDDLGSFVSLYQLGIPDFDEYFNITDDSGEQVGGCGMGVNMKRGSLPNNPDCAIALDVWMMEHSGNARPDTQTRLLLSEYVVEHNMEKSMTRDLPQGALPPIVAQPGLTFQINGSKLVLDCKVTDVRYVQDGPLEGVFETLEMEMVVRSRQ